MQEHGDAIACQAGCTACCRQDLSVCTVEHDYVLAYLASHSIKPSDGARTEIDTHPLFDTLSGGEPCTFLAAGGRCTIYEARPIICRTHGLPIVVHSQIETCALNFRDRSDDLASLPTNHTLMLATLNTTLAVIERLYTGSRRVEPSRTPLSVLRRTAESL